VLKFCDFGTILILLNDDARSCQRQT